jgi:glycosyltransferase involved in cell wall biosynthesis
MSIPSISVLLPTYNYARFLPEAIESVQAQDWPDFELVISDDRSTDESAKIIAAYAARDPRIRFQLQPANLGMVANWNWCLRQARGEYVKFLFGDDRLESPCALRLLRDALAHHPSAALAASARSILNADSKLVAHWDEFQHLGLHSGRAVIERCLLETRNLIGEPSVTLFRRSHAGRGFDPHYRQLVDLEFWFHLLEQGDFCYLPDPLCSFRQHTTQQSMRNAASGVDKWELYELFASCRARAAQKDRALPVQKFVQLFYHLDQHCRQTSSPPPEMLSLRRQLRAEIPPLHYAAFRVRRHLRGIKRALRRSLSPSPGSVPA